MTKPEIATAALAKPPWSSEAWRLWLAQVEYFCSRTTIQPSGCWEWSNVGSNGYGTWRHGGRALGAHRAAYELFHGPANDCVLHKCGNRRCVNPEHLYDGSHQQNWVDAVTDGTASRGSRHPGSKLKEDQVLSIYADRNTPVRTLAETYGVSRQIITDIALREEMGVADIKLTEAAKYYGEEAHQIAGLGLARRRAKASPAQRLSSPLSQRPS